MKKLILTAALLCSVSAAAFAQPIESEPLQPFVPYTLKGETDPMALGSAPVETTPLQTPAQSGDFAPLSSDSSPAEASPPPAQAYEINPQPTPIPADSFPPSPTASTGDITPYYPNNPVSGLPPKDESKFENRIFCTLKISFGSLSAGPDTKTSDIVKSFLDENADKLTYLRSDEGGKKGEFSYCVTVNQHNDKAQIYTNLKSLLNRSNASAPVSVAGKGFTPFKVGGRDQGR